VDIPVPVSNVSIPQRVKYLASVVGWLQINALINAMASKALVASTIASLINRGVRTRISHSTHLTIAILT
jgi:hypothetical protein